MPITTPTDSEIEKSGSGSFPIDFLILHYIKDAITYHHQYMTTCP